MPCYVGLDASKKMTSICVIGPDGTTVREGEVPTSAGDIVRFLRGDGHRYRRVGLEAGSITPWLYEGLVRAGLPVVCIETRHAHAVLKAQPNKTDRADARGIADLMRTGTFRQVHMKTPDSRQIRAVMASRRLLAAKLRDVQNGIRALMLGFGLKLDPRRKDTFEERVRALLRKDTLASSVIRPLLTVRAVLRTEVAALDKRLAALAATDSVCRLLMTAPGVGPWVALTYRTSIDVPTRFLHSRDVGPHLGLVPRTFKSGSTERRGRISKRGDQEARSALYLAASALLRKATRPNWLKAWGLQTAEHRGKKRATVAVARRLAVVMHRMWVSETPFRWDIAR